MCLMHRHNAGELQLLPKQSYRVFRQEDDAEAILDLPLYLPLDEGVHFRGAGRGVWPLGDCGLQRLEQSRGPGVCRDSLLYIDPDHVEICPVTRRWAVQPLDWRRWYSMINSYVVVVLFAKNDDFPCNGCYFLVYQFSVLILPSSLHK